MISPVWKPGNYPITQPFGCTSLTVEPWWNIADCHWHCGVDIGCPSGTPLYAARAGKVTAVSYGILRIQVTGRTEADCYVHIDRSVVGYGAQVAQGQLVAYSGAKVPNGGYLTGPHLHFEVNTGALNSPASSVDPIPVLASLFSGGSGSLPEVDMTPQESQMLADVHDYGARLIYALGVTYLGPGKENQAISAKVAEILAAIKAVPASSGVTADLSPVLAAIADLKAHPAAIADTTLGTAVASLEDLVKGVAADQAEIRLRVDKDLAP